MVAALLLGLALAGNAAAAPSPATMLYYNARLALREGDAVESLKLWMVRNIHEDQTGMVSAYDPDFHSVTWAATGQLGVCQDGLHRDTDGAGLWPLALHNQVVRNLGRQDKPRRPNTFQAFAVGRQQRTVSIGEVLGWQELQTVQFLRGRCTRPVWHQFVAGENPFTALTDRQVAARLLRHLLVLSETTLSDTVRGKSVIAARVFDLDLQLAELAAREAASTARQQGQLGKQLGLAGASVRALIDGQPPSTLDPRSAARAILRDCPAWPVSEWMALSPERRRFVFDAAAAEGADRVALDAVAFGILDVLIARGDGAEATEWIARIGPEPTADPRIWGGDRGQTLLALGPESGFVERGPLALHQGVHQLEQGQVDDALRSFGFALQQAPTSRDSQAVSRLSRRWIGTIAARFTLSEALLATLQTLLPKRDFAVLLEDLLWHAALRADRASFDRGLAAQPTRGAMDRRLALLVPLSRGDGARFVRGIDNTLAESESEGLRFLKAFIERVEREDAEVRAALAPTLLALGARLERFATSSDSGRRARISEELLGRTRGILDGLGILAPGSERDAARARSPSAQTFAGSVRLAPSDPLPWPFRPTATAAPTAFAQLRLVPEEWRDENGARVLGWSIRE